MNHSKKMLAEKHEFALYIPTLIDLVKDAPISKELLISDVKIVHRMAHILRLTSESTCILFDRVINVRTIIKKIDKKYVTCVIQSKELNVALSPTITFLLPLLKREDFENALYALTEVGVSTIQLVHTSKSYCSSFDHKYFERAQRIIISAAEQAKNFAYPELKTPIMLADSLDMTNISTNIFFDKNGDSFFSVAQNLHRDQPKDIVLLVGPEGDLSSEEKKMVMSKHFIVCTLTPTVLRSVQAATLSAGFIRSLLN